VNKLVDNKGKGAVGGRKLGKLAQLMDMPLDIFFEVHTFLPHPEDSQY
jgi:hypothetical protein